MIDKILKDCLLLSIGSLKEKSEGIAKRAQYKNNFHSSEIYSADLYMQLKIHF